jgi:hypothetical protein
MRSKGRWFGSAQGAKFRFDPTLGIPATPAAAGLKLQEIF